MKNVLLMAVLAVSVSIPFPAHATLKRRPAAATQFKVHACEADAIRHADKLLRLHFADDSNAAGIENFGIDDHVTLKSPIRNPVGKGRFDVLEVNGGIYKANYRMRFIYARIQESCVLMGQEILEMSNPY